MVVIPSAWEQKAPDADRTRLTGRWAASLGPRSRTQLENSLTWFIPLITTHYFISAGKQP